MYIEYSPNVCRVIGSVTQYERAVLDLALKFDHPNPSRLQAENPYWDGKVNFWVDSYMTTFPTGLWPHVWNMLYSHGLTESVHVHCSIGLKTSSVQVTADIFADRGITLHDYQVTLANQAIAGNRGVISAPPRSGKTFIQAAIARALDKKTVILIQRDVLLKQHYESFKDLGFDVGMVQGSRRDFDKQVNIAMFQTVWAGQKSKEMLEWLDSVDVMMIDECLDKDTKIKTPCGTKPLGDLKEGDEVVTPTGEVARIKKKWSTRKESVSYTYSDGSTLIASPNHIVPVGGHGNYKLGPISEAKSMLLNTSDVISTCEVDSSEYFLGWFLGDGCAYEVNGHTYVKFAYRRNVSDVLRVFKEQGWPHTYSVNSRGDTTIRMEKQWGLGFLDKWGLCAGKKSHKIRIPDELFDTASPGLIRGMFDTESSRQHNRLSLDSTSHDIIEQLHDMLARHGISSQVGLGGSRHSSKHLRCARLTITGASINDYNAKIGWGLPSKRSTSLGQAFIRRHEKVDLISADPCGVRELVDIELDNDARLFVANGLIVHNCHHAGSADSYFMAGLLSPASWRLGFSGTPYSVTALEDGKFSEDHWRLHGLLGPPLGEISLRYLQDEKFLVNVDIVQVKISEDPSIGELDGNCWHPVYKAGVVDNVLRNRSIVAIAKDMVDKGYFPLILVNQVGHGNELFDRLVDAGVDPVFARGGSKVRTSSGMRTGPLSSGYDMCVAGSGNVLIATQIGDEGVNLPKVDGLILAVGGKADKVNIQRVFRPLTSSEGKTHAMVIDFEDRQHNVLKRQSAARRKIFKSLGFSCKMAFLEQAIDMIPSKL
jgi:superfamily II DNA or RNA helicase